MRELVHDGVRWLVYEMDTRNNPGTRGDSCLIFECDGVVRRVWQYPVDWRELDTMTLWALVDQPPPRASLGRNAVLLNDARVITEHTHLLLAQVAELRATNRTLRGEQRTLLDQCQCSRDQMRDAVVRYAEQLRADGVPPERALVLLKSAIQNGLAGCDEDSVNDAEQLMHDGVHWAIDAYYAA